MQQSAKLMDTGQYRDGSPNSETESFFHSSEEMKKLMDDEEKA